MDGAWGGNRRIPQLDSDTCFTIADYSGFVIDNFLYGTIPTCLWITIDFCGMCSLTRNDEWQ